MLDDGLLQTTVQLVTKFIDDHVVCIPARPKQRNSSSWLTVWDPFGNYDAPVELFKA
jgi:hypothetical protein